MATTTVGEAASTSTESAWRQGTRQSWLLPYVIAGAACVVGGGLLAAATAYVTTEKTAWATAYLVLVGGVAQVILGAAVAWLAPRASHRLAWWSFVCWNLGNAGVLVGQLTGLIILTDVGTALLIAALVMILIAVRRGAHPDAPAAHPGVLWTLRGLIVLLAITMPIGVVLAHLT